MDSENRLCLLLVGLTELRRRLAMAVHESLSQRLVVRHHLNGLDRDELDHYLTHRLRLAGCELPLFEPCTKAPFAGAANVVAYLGRYTHKSAIANHRLVDFDGEHVRFRWRDYAHGNKRKVMRLDAGEFVRRFLLHVLPRRFTRLRHYGVLANRGRARNLALCRALLDQPAAEPREPETSQAMMLRLTGIDITVCRHCGMGTLSRILILAPQFRAAMPVSRGRPP